MFHDSSRALVPYMMRAAREDAHDELHVLVTV